MNASGLQTTGASEIRRVESRFAVAGASLFRRAWLPATPPVRSVVLVHGFAEHSGRYDHVGAWLARRGSAVHAYDQRGHGRTAQKLGRIGPFPQLLDDLEAFLTWVSGEHPGLPQVLVGHSMGGLVAAACLEQRHPAVLAAVLSGPALSLSPDVSPGRRRLASVAGRWLPRLRVRSGIDPRGLSRDPEVVQRYVDDPLVFDQVEAGFAAEMFAAIDRTAADGSAIRCPVLIAHGQDDPLCLASGSERFFASLAAPGSQLRLYPGLRHEIFNEPEYDQVLGDVLDWIESREARGDGPT